jgi:hypothetical protein
MMTGSPSRSCPTGLGIFDKVVRNVKKCEVTENTEKIWAATMEDVKEGVTVGPMFSRDDVSELLGSDQWIHTQRFEVAQRNKVSGGDAPRPMA